jgi:hypothetical protein
MAVLDKIKLVFKILPKTNKITKIFKFVKVYCNR